MTNRVTLKNGLRPLRYFFAFISPPLREAFGRSDKEDSLGLVSLLVSMRRFVQLAEYLSENYVLGADFHRERLYLRKDRMADKAQIVAPLARAAAKWVDDPWNGDAAPEFLFTELRPLRMVEGLQVAMMEPPERIFWPLIGTE